MTELDPDARRKWVDAISENDRAHLERARELRVQIFEDESMDPFDRAVLGLFGRESGAATYYNSLRNKVAESVGQAIISVTTLEPKGRVIGASAGIIDGGIETELDVYRGGQYSQEEFAESPRCSAVLSVPLRPIMSFSSRRNDWLGRDGDRYFFDKDITGEDKIGGDLAIFYMHTDIKQNTKGIHAADDVKIRGQEALIIGREEAYSSPLFMKGVGDLLAVLEQHADETLGIRG